MRSWAGAGARQTRAARGWRPAASPHAPRRARSAHRGDAARAPLRPAAPCPAQRRAPRRPADGDGSRPDHGSEAQGRVSPAPLPPASAEAHGLSLLLDKPVLRGVDVTSGRAVVITKHSNTPLSSTAKSPMVLCKGTRLDRGAATGPSRWPLRGPALPPLLRPRERHQRQCALAWTQPGCSVLAGAGAVPPGHTAFPGLQGNILCFSSNHALPGGHRRTTLRVPFPRTGTRLWAWPWL